MLMVISIGETESQADETSMRTGATHKQRTPDPIDIVPAQIGDGDRGNLIGDEKCDH